MKKRLGDRVGWPLKGRQTKRGARDTDPEQRRRSGGASPCADADAAPAETPPIPATGTTWAAAASDRGKLRANNEDSFLCDPERGLFIICDGMGGHSAGEVASARAIRFLDEMLTAEALEQAFSDGRGLADWLRQVLQQVNDAVLALGQGNEGRESMATTVVMGVVRDRTLHVVNLGDSRVYLIRDGQAVVLTKDHSVAAALAEQGQLEPERARAHPLRNQLTASLGLRQPVAPFHRAGVLQPADRVLFCSDGLWDMLSDREIARIAVDHSDPAAAARALIQAANEAGGADNITVIVLMVQAAGSPLAGATASETAHDP